jgi:hypothetical protein
VYITDQLPRICYDKNMPTFFRREKKQPFMYSAIETRRSKPSYSGWIIAGVLLTGLLLGLYLIFT